MNLDNEIVTDYDRMTVLGKELPIPYTIANMDSAYASLKSKGYDVPSFKAEVTHLYVRFLPKDFNELDILKKDSTLILFDFPLHYEIKKQGSYYHDPNLSSDQITWQYCVFDINKELPKVYYEIIAKVCISDSDKKGMKNSNVYSGFFLLLESEANNLVGIKSTLKSSQSSSWTPSGTITCAYGFPIESIKVKAWSGLKVREGWTNSSGVFTINGEFTSDVKYSIDWERYNFSIRDGFMNQASYSIDNATWSSWNPVIGQNVNDLEELVGKYHALIYRAAYHYYYKDIHGLKRPPLNGTFQPQMKIAANYSINVDYAGLHAAWKRVLGILSWINIWNPTSLKDPSTGRSSSESGVYATVIHELAHASHWDINASDYNSTETVVKESWAKGVERDLTKMAYSGYNALYARLNYTGIVEDLMDGFGTTSINKWYDFSTEAWGTPDISKSYYDQVSGYSIVQIENTLDGQRSWDDWRNVIINMYSNATENKVYEAFSYWNTK